MVYVEYSSGSDTSEVKSFESQKASKQSGPEVELNG